MLAEHMMLYSSVCCAVCSPACCVAFSAVCCVSLTHRCPQGLQVAGQDLDLAPVLVCFLFGPPQSLGVPTRGLRQVGKLPRRGTQRRA